MYVLHRNLPFAQKSQEITRLIEYGIDDFLINNQLALYTQVNTTNA
jgi:hypothetical protein